MLPVAAVIVLLFFLLGSAALLWFWWDSRRVVTLCLLDPATQTYAMRRFRPNREGWTVREGPNDPAMRVIPDHQRVYKSRTGRGPLYLVDSLSGDPCRLLRLDPRPEEGRYEGQYQTEHMDGYVIENFVQDQDLKNWTQNEMSGWSGIALRLAPWALVALVPVMLAILFILFRVGSAVGAN